MKVVVLIALLFCGNVFANPSQVAFRGDTVVPASAQKAIQQAIQKQCPFIVNKGWPVVESRSTSTYEVVDTMISHIELISTFTVQAEDNDGMHPYTFNLRVRTHVYNQGVDIEDAQVVNLFGTNYCSN